MALYLRPALDAKYLQMTVRYKKYVDAALLAAVNTAEAKDPQAATLATLKKLKKLKNDVVISGTSRRNRAIKARGFFFYLCDLGITA